MNTSPPVLLVALVAAGVSALVIFLRLRFARAGLDLPGHRSLHTRPTPHGGGLGIVAAMVLCGIWVGADMAWLLGILLLAFVSWVDDWRPLPFWLRLNVHFFIASGVVFWNVQELSILLFFPILSLVWTTNAYNFMDGADGLAGSMALTGFAAYAAALAWGGGFALSGLCVAAMAGAAGFLFFNWYPARIFMGDTGSIPLGFLAGGIGWYGAYADIWPYWFPLLVFSPFWFDATATLLRRVVRRERFWEAHKVHYYQRMVQLGLSHGAMSSRWFCGMLIAAVSALLVLRFAPAAGWSVLLVWVCVMAVLGYRIDRSWISRT